MQINVHSTPPSLANEYNETVFVMATEYIHSHHNMIGMRQDFEMIVMGIFRQ